MTETHVTNDSVVTPEGVASDRLITPKRDRAAYMRDYRARKAADNSPQQLADNAARELNGAIKPEAEIDNSEIKPEPELNKPDEQITAEQYERKVIPEADEATERLKQQISAINKSAELNRQQQAQTQQLVLAQRLFHDWKSDGLDEREEQFLLANNPQVIIDLTNFAANEATK